MFEIKNNLKNSKCLIGILIIENTSLSSSKKSLDEVKVKLESDIVGKYGEMSRQELKDLYPMNSYVSYYKKFSSTYHVLPQLESVANGKKIPSISPLVSIMFMAELKNMILSAGHDLDTLEFPIILSDTPGNESYIGISGKVNSTVENDFVIKDNEAIISSILKGPDRRTAIGKETKNVLFAAYAPEGIGESTLYSHLDDIEAFVKIFSDSAVTSLKKVYCAI